MVNLHQLVNSIEARTFMNDKAFQRNMHQLRGIISLMLLTPDSCNSSLLISKSPSASRDCNCNQKYVTKCPC